MFRKSLLLTVSALLMLSQEIQCIPHRTLTSFASSSSSLKTPQKFHFPETMLFNVDDGSVLSNSRRSKFGMTSEEIGEVQDQEENDSSAYNAEVEKAIGHRGSSPKLSKRRKGPTLSVVNPLEILRQRLMLDLARRRIHENQQQIVANAEMLENLGKRSERTFHQQQSDPQREFLQ